MSKHLEKCTIDIAKNNQMVRLANIHSNGPWDSILYRRICRKKGATEFVKFLINSDARHIFSLKSKSSLNERGKADRLFGDLI